LDLLGEINDFGEAPEDEAEDRAGVFLGLKAGVGAEVRAVAGLAADVSDHCYALSHVSLGRDSIGNRFIGKQKGLAGIGQGGEAGREG